MPSPGQRLRPLLVPALAAMAASVWTPVAGAPSVGGARAPSHRGSPEATAVTPGPDLAPDSLPGAVDLDTASLATGPYARLQGLMQRTIFQVDVLRAELRVGPETARSVEALLRGSPGGDAPRDSVARALAFSRNALVRVHFLRDLGMDRFIEGVRRDLRRAREVGWIGEATYRQVRDSLPAWYEFLRDRGVHDDDEMYYRIRGDTLRTLYVSAAGDVLLDQVDTGPDRGRAVLGGYLAPDASLREELLRSLVHR